MNGSSGQQKRVFQGEDGQWYFRARRNGTEGPFTDRSSARRALERHIFDCHVRSQGMSWPRQWSPMRLLRRAPDAPVADS